VALPRGPTIKSTPLNALEKLRLASSRNCWTPSNINTDTLTDNMTSNNAKRRDSALRHAKDSHSLMRHHRLAF
jgi:hypothetical protein